RSYDDIGQVEGAVAQHAEEIFKKLTNNGADAQMVKTFQRLFTRLVTPGEGQEDTRRVVTRQELHEDDWLLAQRLAGEGNRLFVPNLVATTGRAVSRETAGIWSPTQITTTKNNRLGVTNAPCISDETAEVVHESLIRHWPRQLEWINRDRDFLSWQRHIKPNV